MRAIKKSTTSSKGFTLIEMLVAVAVFSVVMLIAVGSLLTLVDANRKAQAIKSVMNNLNFALESMVRNARVGSNYHCDPTDALPDANIDTPRDCASGGLLFAFEASDGDPSDPTDQQVYRFINGSIERSDDSGATFIRVTAPEVRIEEMSFYVIGAPRGDSPLDLQPKMIVTVRGFAGATEKAKTEFSLQAVSSQRVFDI